MARKPTAAVRANDAVTTAIPAAAASARALDAMNKDGMTDDGVPKDGAADTAIAATVAAVNDSVAGVVAGFDKTQNEVKETMNKAVKTAEDFVSFSQGNFEAMMKAGQIWIAGVQDMHKAAAASAQAQVEAAMGSFKALSGVKSMKEAMDLQTSVARTSLETAMAETGKLTDASVKLAEQAMAPITERVTLAVEKFGRVA